MLVFENNQAPSRLKDRDGNPLMWRITVRQNRTYSIEMSDFALQNYLDSGTLITTLNDAIMACVTAEAKIAAEETKKKQAGSTVIEMLRRVEMHQSQSHSDAIDTICKAMNAGRITSHQLVSMQQQKLFEHRHDKNFMSTVMKNIDIEIAAELSK